MKKKAVQKRKLARKLRSAFPKVNSKVFLQPTLYIHSILANIE